MSRPRYAVVAAAGRGTRYEGEEPKVLAPIAGRTSLERVTMTLDQALGAHRQLVVIGYEAERVRASLGEAPHRQWVYQHDPCGTGHALALALAEIDEPDADVYFVCGDKPLLRASSLAALRAGFEAQGGGQAFLTGQIEGPPELSRQGRVVRESGAPVAIVEYKVIQALSAPLQLGRAWTRDELLALRECNVSTYVWRLAMLRALVPDLAHDPTQAEIMVTDLVQLAAARGWPVTAQPLHDPSEGWGVDTLEQKALAETVATQRLAAGEEPWFKM